MSERIDPEIEAELERLVPNHKDYLAECTNARRLFRGPKVLKSNSAFRIAGVAYDQTPVLVDAYGSIIDEPSQWLIYIRTMGTAKGSVLQ
jgi:hypothetical protein